VFRKNKEVKIRKLLEENNSFLSTGSFFQTLGKFDQNASLIFCACFTGIFGVFSDLGFTQTNNPNL